MVREPTYSVQYWLIPLSPVQLPPGLGFKRHPGDHMPTAAEDAEALKLYKALTRLYPGAYELRRMYWPNRGPHDVSVEQKVVGRWTSTPWSVTLPQVPSFPF